ncbi:hypothetical protein JX580_11730 [Thiomicrospira microaerophila]|uniref:hypothetical protein n=1 Tax=Thiomicrospira microaerophila TaxID=406020 RepID=UPI00200FC350|nr:hypothetical protein [Thiomicrospira microaerophila]UQB42303.1 hypothetical protein JX580_11730 [Thiomicrospira microaerophila]
MKLKKMLEKLVKLLDSEKRECKKTIKSLREVLKSLKQKEQKLRLELDQITDEQAKQTLQDQLNVIAAQRAKGKDRLLELRAQSQDKG